MLGLGLGLNILLISLITRELTNVLTTNLKQLISSPFSIGSIDVTTIAQRLAYLWRKNTKKMLGLGLGLKKHADFVNNSCSM